MELANGISELKQVTFLITRTSTGSKVDVFHQSQPLTQSSDVTHAVRVVKNVTCLSSLILQTVQYNRVRDGVAKSVQSSSGSIFLFQNFLKIMLIMGFSNCKIYKLCHSKSASILFPTLFVL